MALKKLNAEHIIAIGWLSQPNKGGKTYEDIAAECGVTRRTLQEWRKDDLFDRELKREMIRRSQDKLPELIESLAVIAIRDGNAQMAKLALQINGMLTDKVEVRTGSTDVGIDYEALDDELASFGERFGKSEEE
jgi:predicted transcriptional regulator